MALDASPSTAYSEIKSSHFTTTPAATTIGGTMKHVKCLLAFVLLGVLAQVVPAAEKANVAELKKGFGTYFSMMDQMQQEVRKVRDAKGTAKLLDEWERANEIMLNTTLKYKKLYPEAVASKTPPAELAEEMKKVADSKFTYGSLTSDLDVLVKMFGKDPEVKAAMERQRKAIKQLQDADEK